MITTRMDQRRAIYDPQLPYEENYRRGPGAGWVAADPPADAAFRARFAGVELRRPFGIPAGPLLNAAYVEAAFRNGFDLNVYKTVRSVAYPVHPAPNVLSVHIPDGLHSWGAALRARADRDFAAPLSICNSFGVPSRGPDEWQPDLQRAVAAAGPGQATIASFQARLNASWIDVFEPRPFDGGCRWIASPTQNTRPSEVRVA